MITVLVADDHEAIRWALRAVVKKEPDIDIVAEAADGRTAVSLARERSPRVAVIDIAMPGLNGIEATRQITAKAPEVKVIAMSALENKTNVERMLEAGAVGYVLKSGEFKEILTAIRVTAEGHTYLSPQIAGIVVKSLVHQRTRRDASSFSILSPREREVLQLLAEGSAPKEIADLLEVSITTIHTHRMNLMAKLDLHSTAELTKFAVREGITPL